MKNDEGQGGNGKSAEGRVIVSEMMVERASLGVWAEGVLQVFKLS